MLKKTLFYVVLLMICVSPVSAEDTPPENKVYLPIISNLGRYGMVYVQAGSFMMGCDPDHNDGFECPSYYLPVHEVFLGPYYIDKYEVTNAELNQYITQVGGTPPPDPHYQDPDYANHPARVQWGYASYYCSWAGKRLPTEYEWEKAARGTEPRAYPWGDQSATCGLANYGNCVGDTVEVGSYPAGASPYGAMDMAGNLSEWTSSLNEYPTTSPIPMSPSSYIVRGGQWNDTADYVLTSWRSKVTVLMELGFRCAVSLP